MIENGMSKSREMFEEWYRDYYSFKLRIYSEKYSLDKCEYYPFQYIQDIPHHDWQVWRNCHRAVLEDIGSAIGCSVVGSGEP